MLLKPLLSFVSEIEEILMECGADDVVYDSSGSYSKSSFLSSVISDAKELIKYGEYQIALENMIDNLLEVSITLDKETVILARQAFGEEISSQNERVLEALER